MSKGKAAARISDPVAHPLPPVLTGGPGSLNVLIGKLPAWRGVPAGAVSALQSAKKISDTVIQTVEAASKAAAGTPGAPAAIASEQSAKLSSAATMSSMISSAAASAAPSIADIHLCATPLPIPPHGPGVVIDGSKTVLINGLPACRMGDTILEALGPSNKITKGELTVLIGN
ncbi:PAAR domain-containing protein [Nostoc sphaeroides CHAB 2801]|uniref:PAAR domain-containing protein n=1 Tax=Nostoc sphaeroides TaxID=446679 RepID=UPI001E56CE99|nr:PAAR domain-containing protein [Nostoc sphaeroides]MCC5632300.1 PAAR domain-containing protein [Nostoc sphaeroides CHAB 2801]